MAKEAILTFDIGTTACKTILFSLEGEALAADEREYPLYHPEPGAAEQEAGDWWKAVVDTTRFCLQKYAGGGGEPPEIIAIGLSSQRETIVPLDGEGREMSRALVWMDRRARGEAEALAGAFGRERLHQWTGMIPDSTFSAAKLLWWRRWYPDLVREAFIFLQPKEYVAYKLTGNFATDYSLASRTMLLDVREWTWRKELLDFVGVHPEQMPPLIPSDAVVGKVTPEAAALLGITAGIPVVAGGGDRQCEALGAGISGRRVMESTGTTSNLSYATTKLGKLDPRLVYSAHVLRDHWLLEQGMTTSGSILRWFRDNFCSSEVETGRVTGENPYEIINRMVKQSPPGARKLFLLPFFMGAKASRWNPVAQGALLGLNLETTRGDLARAVMEGVAFELRACLDILREMGLVPSEILVMGGGARSRVWNQIKADMYGVRVRRPRVTDAASLGAMVLAGTGVGVFTDPAETARRLNPVEEEYRPRLEARELYTRLSSFYEEFYQAMEGLYAKLAAL